MPSFLGIALAAIVFITGTYSSSKPAHTRDIWVQYKIWGYRNKDRRKVPAHTGVFQSASGVIYTAALDTCRLRELYCGDCMLAKNGLTSKTMLKRMWSNQEMLKWISDLGLTQQDRSETLEIVPDRCLSDKGLIVWDGMLYKRFEPQEIPPEKADFKGLPGRFVTFHFVFLYYVDADSISMVSSEQVDPFSAGGRPGPSLDVDGEYVYYRNRARASFRCKLATRMIEPIPQIRPTGDLLVPFNRNALLIYDTANSSLTLLDRELDTAASIKAELGPWTRYVLALDSSTYVVTGTAPPNLSDYIRQGFRMRVFLVDFASKQVSRLFDTEHGELIDADWADRRNPPPEVDLDTLK